MLRETINKCLATCAFIYLHSYYLHIATPSQIFAQTMFKLYFMCLVNVFSYIRSLTAANDPAYSSTVVNNRLACIPIHEAFQFDNFMVKHLLKRPKFCSSCRLPSRLVSSATDWRTLVDTRRNSRNRNALLA